MNIERFPPDSPILVAESRAASKAYLRRAFREFQLTNVTYLEDYTKALLAGRQSQFSLILISTSLYAGSAYDLFFLIREEGKNKETPIIILYSQGEEAIAKRASIMGANGLIERPVSPETLQKVLEECLDMRIVTIADELVERLGESLEPLGEDENGEPLEDSLAPAPDPENPKECGFNMLENDDCDGAEKVFLNVMREHEDSIELYFDLAEVCFVRGEADAAEEMLLKAEKIDPMAKKKFMHRERSFVLRGNKKLLKKKPLSAKNEFTGAVVANKKSVPGHFGLSESYRGLGDKESAEKHHDIAMSIDQRPKDLHIYNRIGISARRDKDYQKAIEAYDRSLAFDPDDPVLIYNKALAFVGMRLYRSAIASLEKALEIDHDFVEARNARNAIIDVMTPKRRSRAATNPPRRQSKIRMRQIG